MTLFLRQTQEFRFSLALYNDLLTRDALIRALTGDLANDGVRVLTLDLREPGEGRTLLARVESLVTTVAPGERVAVMVVNLEGRVDYSPELAQPGDSGMAFLETANLHRELFPRACPGPLVIWTTELLERAFVHHAPDLWHWRSHTFDLRTQVETRATATSPATPAARALVPSDDYRLHPTERLHRLEEELVAYRKAKMRLDEVRVLNEMGKAYLDAGEARRSIGFFEAVLKIANKIDGRALQGTALGNLGAAYANLGEPSRAIEFHEQDLAIAREIGDRRGESRALNDMGIAYANLGEPRRAIEFFEQHLALARERGDRRGESMALGNLGCVYRSLGEPRRAVEFFEQDLAIAREMGDRRGEGTSLGNLGCAYSDLGEPRRAVEFHEQHLAIAREMGDRRGEGRALWNSALIFKFLGDLPKAIAQAEASLSIREATEDPDRHMVRAALDRWHVEAAENAAEA